MAYQPTKFMVPGSYYDDGFKQMIADALAGKLELIVTNAVITKGRFIRAKQKPITTAFSP